MESIDNLKKSMLRDRTEQRARINDSENKIRESIIQFHDNKSRCIQHANQAEIERITAKKNKKELQLRDVTNL